MKWSEQMRALQSEDEHYNQLMLDTRTGDLFINDERIDVLNSFNNGHQYKIENSKFIKIIKKYPFFTDLKFLLNCIFKMEDNNFNIYYSKCNILRKYRDRYEIYQPNQNVTLLIYIEQHDMD